MEEQPNLELGTLLQRLGVCLICGLAVANSEVLLLVLFHACHLPAIQVVPRSGCKSLQLVHIKPAASAVNVTSRP